jgi:hypothetical protein
MRNVWRFIGGTTLGSALKIKTSSAMTEQVLNAMGLRIGEYKKIYNTCQIF